METMIPVLPDPPVHNPTDYVPSFRWADVKYLLVYRDPDGNTRVIKCETEEEFQDENLVATFSSDYTLIDSWRFE